MTEEAIEACLRLRIDPKSLRLKTFEDFKEPGVNQTVQQVRYNHYTDKRRCKSFWDNLKKTIIGNLMALEEAFKSKLAQMAPQSSTTFYTLNPAQSPLL